jgi:hypothetical protein
MFFLLGGTWSVYPYVSIAPCFIYLLIVFVCLCAECFAFSCCTFCLFTIASAGYWREATPEGSWSINGGKWSLGACSNPRAIQDISPVLIMCPLYLTNDSSCLSWEGKKKKRYILRQSPDAKCSQANLDEGPHIATQPYSPHDPLFSSHQQQRVAIRNVPQIKAPWNWIIRSVVTSVRPFACDLLCLPVRHTSRCVALHCIAWETSKHHHTHHPHQLLVKKTDDAALKSKETAGRPLLSNSLARTDESPRRTKKLEIHADAKGEKSRPPGNSSESHPPAICSALPAACLPARTWPAPPTRWWKLTCGAETVGGGKGPRPDRRPHARPRGGAVAWRACTLSLLSARRAAGIGALGSDWRTEGAASSSSLTVQAKDGLHCNGAGHVMTSHGEAAVVVAGAVIDDA